jgi:endonuclease/exonuclease/phosphatase family metal-dependent hydrolase
METPIKIRKSSLVGSEKYAVRKLSAVCPSVVWSLAKRRQDEMKNPYHRGTYFLNGALPMNVANTRFTAMAMRHPPRLKCVTFNLLHGGLFSGWRGHAQQLSQRLAVVAAELRRLHADVIGLQEASTSPTRGNVAARLAAQLGYHVVYAPASCRLSPCARVNAWVARGMNFTEGPALVSRFPIAAWDAQVLPRGGQLTEPRVLLYATLQTPWGPLPVATTHTSGTARQHRRIAEVLWQRRGPLPVLLLGDFNAVEASPAMVLLTQEAEFHDAFRCLHPTAAGYTADQALFAPTPTVSQRIDYILVLSGVERPARICSSQVILNTPGRLQNGRYLWPSDHYGVLGEVEVDAPGVPP